MTFLEKAMQIEKNNILNTCPFEYFDNAPDCDRNTSKASNGDVSGCRDMACTECWNQPVKEE